MFEAVIISVLGVLFILYEFSALLFPSRKLEMIQKAIALYHVHKALKSSGIIDQIEKEENIKVSYSRMLHPSTKMMILMDVAYGLWCFAVLLTPVWMYSMVIIVLSFLMSFINKKPMHVRLDALVSIAAILSVIYYSFN